MTVIHKNGVIVSRSKNLRGMLSYARRESRKLCASYPAVRVARVHVLQLPQGALVRVRWTDGAYSVARFASCTVARLFAQRRRTWPAHRYTPLHYWHAPMRGDA